MKKVVTINIAGRSFYIDEDAFARLDQYLKNLENWSREKEGGQEIFNDIEARIRELFEEKINPTTGVITVEMVDEIITTMGEPQDFSEDESASSGSSRSSSFDTGSTFTTGPTSRMLYRDIEDKVFGGVCSGIAAYFGIDRVVVRVLFALFAFLSFGTVLIIYFILWIAIPPALSTAQRLEMRGDFVNISNIEKNIKNEYNDVKQRFQRSSTYKKGENYLNSFEKRDRNVFIIAAVIVGIIILGNLVSILFTMGYAPAMHFNMPFMHFSLIGALPLSVILLLLGLAFRSAMKGFLILIAIILTAFFLFKIVSMVAWPYGIHTVL